MSDKEEIEKRVTPANLLKAILVVIAVQLLSLVVTNQNLPVYQDIVNSSGYSYDPFGPTPSGGAGNAIILVGFAFVLTLGLVWMLRKKMVMSFRVVVFGSVSISAFILTLLTADVFAISYLPPGWDLIFSLAAASLVVVLVGYTIFVKNRPWLSTLILAFIGAEVGSFFAETLSPYTALALPIAFSLYDIYAVFRGPLRQLVGTAPNIALVGMSIRAGEFTLGLGDVVFYTMLPSLALFRVGTYAAISTLLAIDVGVLLTLFLLSKKRLLPGLPIPMLLGVLAFLFFYL